MNYKFTCQIFMSKFKIYNCFWNLILNKKINIRSNFFPALYQQVLTVSKLFIFLAFVSSCFNFYFLIFLMHFNILFWLIVLNCKLFLEKHVNLFLIKKKKKIMECLYCGKHHKSKRKNLLQKEPMHETTMHDKSFLFQDFRVLTSVYTFRNF